MYYEVPAQGVLKPNKQRKKGSKRRSVMLIGTQDGGIRLMGKTAINPGFLLSLKHDA